MCDTIVALGNATADGSVIFAKNSDREPNETHELVHLPRATHPAGSSVQCTYIEIPQAPETFAVLLAKPFWIWGCEMGANDHGVVIGNEAVFTKVPHETGRSSLGKGPGLTGMDLIRLALERAAAARSALDVIADLLATFGQGGNCGFAHKLYYHNSFLIADPNEAWILETAGRQWAAQRVKDVGSISNAITIGREWDLASEGLVDYAIEQGWCKKRSDFHFGRCYSDFLYTRFSAARARQYRTTELLTADKGRITAETMMAALRDHGPDAGPDWTPGRGLTGADVCMHAGFGPIRISQSVGSLVSHLTPKSQTHWLTGTSAPCTGIFKPVWLDAGLPDLEPSPTNHYDRATLWWRHESLHRLVLRDYATRLPFYREERDTLEADFIRAAADFQNQSAAERAAFSARCFAEADEATAGWTERVQAAPIKQRPPFLYATAWRTFNRQADWAE